MGMMQKVLDGLVQEDKVKEKVNGKQKAYAINQDEFAVASEAELEAFDKEATKVQNELNAQIKVKEDKIRSFNSQLTTGQAKEKLREVQNEIAHLEQKLDDLSNQTGKMVDQDTMKA